MSGDSVRQVLSSDRADAGDHAPAARTRSRALRSPGVAADSPDKLNVPIASSVSAKHHQLLQPRLRPSVRHPEGLPRCQAWRRRDGKHRQCQRAARRGFRTCGFHGAGFAAREQAGTAKNPAAARLVTGRYAKLETLEMLAPTDRRAFVALGMRVLEEQIDALAGRLGVGCRKRKQLGGPGGGCIG